MKLLEDLYFVGGSQMSRYYLVNFTAYGDSRDKVDGVMVIYTGGSAIEGYSDLVYNVKYNSSLKLNSKDLYAWSKDMVYIYFDSDDIKDLKGDLENGTRTIRDNDEFYINAKSNQDSVEGLVYTPSGSSAYSESIRFTAVDDRGVTEVGEITFCVVRADVPQVQMEVDPNRSVTFKTVDFSTVAGTAVGSTNGIDGIKIMALPSEGALVMNSKTK